MPAGLPRQGLDVIGQAEGGADRVGLVACEAADAAADGLVLAADRLLDAARARTVIERMVGSLAVPADRGSASEAVAAVARGVDEVLRSPRLPSLAALMAATDDTGDFASRVGVGDLLVELRGACASAGRSAADVTRVRTTWTAFLTACRRAADLLVSSAWDGYHAALADADEADSRVGARATSMSPGGRRASPAVVAAQEAALRFLDGADVPPSADLAADAPPAVAEAVRTAQERSNRAGWKTATARGHLIQLDRGDTGRIGGPGLLHGQPRHVEDLDEPELRGEDVLRLATARVIFADHDLLRRDFPALRSDALAAAHPEIAIAPSHARPALEQRRIDEWLLHHAGYVSTSQAAACVVNTPIATIGGAVRAHRPPRYGRAAIVELKASSAVPPPGVSAPWIAETDGLLDLKGIGVAPGRTPRPGLYSDGLLQLDLALRELLFQRLIEAVFRHAGTSLSTVPVYGLLDAGFDSTNVWHSGSVRPAAIIVRGAHRRHRRGTELPARGSVEQHVLCAVELLLRRYGVTSVGAPGTLALCADDRGHVTATVDGRPATASRAQIEALWAMSRRGRWPVLEGINVQTTRVLTWEPLLAELVDFGQFVVRGEMDLPLVSLVRDRPLRFGGVRFPDRCGYVRPHPRSRATPDEWGERPIDASSAALLGLPRGTVLERPHELGAVLAMRWRRGDVDGAGVLAAVQAHVRATSDAWA
jgi:hypothetical protein